MSKNPAKATTALLSKHPPDIWTISCCLLIIYYSQYPDIIDAINSYLYVVIILTYRYLIVKQPFCKIKVLLHTAACFSIVNSFDKVSGYHHLSSLHEDLASLAFLLIFFMTLRYIYHLKTFMPVLALVILYSNILLLPLDITKNVIGRYIYKNIPAVYITKIDLPHIYGVSLYDKGDIVRFTQIGGQFEADKYVCCIDSLGYGSMEPQAAQFPFLGYELMKILYASDKVPGRDTIHDPRRDTVIAEKLQKNLPEYETLIKKLNRDITENKLKRIFLNKSLGRVLATCLDEKSRPYSRHCLSTFERNEYFKILLPLSIISVEIEDSLQTFFIIIEKSSYDHQLFRRKRGIAYSIDKDLYSRTQHGIFMPIMGDWYVFDMISF